MADFMYLTLAFTFQWLCNENWQMTKLLGEESIHQCKVALYNSRSFYNDGVINQLEGLHTFF